MKASLSCSILAISAIILTTSDSTGASLPGTWRGQSLAEFNGDDAHVTGWQIVNDGVMGGLSEGHSKMTGDGTLHFHGDLSLENNGGFSSIRSADVDLNLSNDLGILIRVKGDGRTYKVRLNSDARYRGMPVSFSGEFKTAKGQWNEIKIPFSDFEGSWRGTDLPKANLNPAVITRVGLILADKKQGAFELEVDWIRTYGKGQGKFVDRKPLEKEEAAQPVAEGKPRLVATAVADGRFTTLKTALDTAGLTPFFQWDNPLTVLAPTDEAFAKLPKEQLESLLKPENKKQLVTLLSYHVSPGANELADSLSNGRIKTVEGSPLKVAFNEGRVRINDASLIDADVKCRDGIIHVIDTVLLPPEFAGQP